MGDRVEWDIIKNGTALRATGSRMHDHKRVVSGFFTVSIDKEKTCRIGFVLYHPTGGEVSGDTPCDHADLAAFFGVEYGAISKNDAVIADNIGADVAIAGIGVRLGRRAVHPAPGTGFPCEPCFSLHQSDFARKAVKAYLETGKFK